MLYPIAFSSRVQNVEPHFFAILGINFRRVEVSIEGRDDEKKNEKNDRGSKDMNQLHLFFMLLHLFLNSEYADIVHFL